MGTSTNGQLSFGVIFEEGFTFPWDADPYDGSIQSWWLDIRGFVNPIPSPFDEHGEYKPGINSKSPVIGEYLRYEREWMEKNPIPVRVVNYCSGNYPMYILAIKHIYNSRGYPQQVDVAELLNTNNDELKLREFLEEFKIEYNNEIKWWLSSYWG